MECISYKCGYKYQLKADYVVDIKIKSNETINLDFLVLSTSGELTIRKGYAWDGPSGPTFDTLNFMRGSLVHDALYQLIRESRIDNQYREYADQLLQKMCKQDGMSTLRAWWVYQGVRRFGDPAADPANKRPIIKAPKQCQ